MLIEKIEIFHVAMPMKETWRTAFGEMDVIDSVLVRMVAEGYEGWGEAAPYAAPNYCPEFAVGAFAVIRDWLGPALLGQEVSTGEALQDRLEPFKGNYFAKGAVDCAWWDAFARSRDEPLSRTIGSRNNEVEVGADISVMEDLDALTGEIAKVQDQGFKRTKLKFRAGWGLEMVARVREAFPEATFHVDCNSGFTLADAAMFKDLDAYDLAMIEQPLGHDDLIDHSVLQRQLKTPICLDESIVSVDRARKAIDIGACRWVNLKVTRVGGLTNAIAIHDLCRARDIPCWVGGMLESAIGQGPSMALASLDNIHYPNDIFPTSRLYENDLSEPEVVLDGSLMIRLPDRPGCGFTPHPGRLANLTVSHAVVARA
jgi:O-succinylbenzoate synthase